MKGEIAVGNNTNYMKRIEANRKEDMIHKICRESGDTIVFEHIFTGLIRLNGELYDPFEREIHVVS